LRYLEGDKSLQVTVSAGISALGLSHSEGDAVMAARMACDAAKDHGRNCVEVYDQENQSIIRRYDDMYLVSEIQKSLDSDAFSLYAQPIVPLDDGKGVTRYEILLRMKDKQGDRVSSGALFSAAERYQLMPQIDRWVVSKTLSCLAEFTDYLRDSDVTFAINLSGQSLGDAEILNFVEDEIESSGIEPRNLCFEITESAAVSSRNRARSFINALRRRGCGFSLDDFGAGLSSFAYLKSFDVDTLKIDGSFVRDICSNRISESMVAAITQVARVMQLDTVAEYAETPEVTELLRGLGVDYAQGHAVGKPRPLADVLQQISGDSESNIA
jgi:EAL domain-containing protein (putative c-di-GMP-specific phosphodiesterase class I)